MDKAIHRRNFEEWLATRPECVKRLAEEFPPGSRFGCSADRSRPLVYLVGYTEDDGLLVSLVNPAVNHEEAVATAWRCSAALIRSGRILDS